MSGSTANVYEIPLIPAPQTFSITLNNTSYFLSLNYRDATDGGWFIDIADSNENAIVSGIPLITGANLLAPYGYTGLLGQLIVQTDGDPTATPTFDSLGVTTHLYYIPPASGASVAVATSSYSNAGNVAPTSVYTVPAPSPSTALDFIRINSTGTAYEALTPTETATALNVLANPMTGANDIIVGGTSGVPARLGVGTTGQILTVGSGGVEWATPSAGFANPMTTINDIIVGGLSGVATRLPKGSQGQVLTVGASALEWATPPYFGNPMTSAGDIIIGQTGGTAARLGIGNPGQVLSVSSSSTLVWGTPDLSSGTVTPTGGATAQSLADWLSVFVPKSSTNNVTQETLTGVTEGTNMGLYAGTSAAPNTTDTQPILWLQRHTSKSLPTITAQTVGGIFTDVEVHGSGSSASPTQGAWIGVMSSVNGLGTNVGSSTAPAYDTKGDVVGMAGFAANTGVPGDGHIITGLWGWAKGPIIDATTYANLPAQNWTICGMEVNVTINSPDVGVQTGLIGNGSSVGYLATNYRPTSAGILDWTFGIVLAGTPNDGNYSSQDIANWNGFHTGLLLDKIKNWGIQFGYYIGSSAYGIGFQTSYAGMAQRPKGGIYMGDTQLNWGEYTGTVFNLGDEWANAGQRYYYGNNGSETLFGSLGVGTAASGTVDHKVHINIDGVDYYLLASTSPT